MFDYAHKNTETGEKFSPTSPFNNPKLSEELRRLRTEAFKREIPTSDDETLCFLQTVLLAVKPKNILEIGTATGISAAHMLLTLPESQITTIEKRAEFFGEACENFKAIGLENRVKAILGDAGEEMETLSEGAFDFIFLDGAKVQYIKYLPRLKKLLKPCGILLADDVLLYGYITGEVEVPKKRKMLVEHVKEYIDAVTKDEELSTTIINAGNGLAMSVKL